MANAVKEDKIVEDKKEEVALTLLEAVEKGLAVLKSDVDLIVKEEIKKERAKFLKEARVQIAKEAQEKHERDISRQSTSFIDGTGLTNPEFGHRLLKMNVLKKYLSVLRDEHHRLTDKQIWAIIRENYKGK